MPEITVTLPVPPLVNRYWRRAGTHTYLSPAGRAYKQTVAEIMDAKPLKGNVAISATIYRARKAGDLDNYAKGLLDAMVGLAYEDDKQVTNLHMVRRDDKTNPRCEVRVWSVTE